MITRKKIVLSFVALVSFSAACAANAQNPKFIAEHKDWRSYSGSVGGETACFAVSLPKAYVPASKNPTDRHGDVYFYITRRLAQKVESEPSLKVGFSFREDSTVTATVGERKYAFFVVDDRAFLENTADLSAFISSLRAGKSLEVSGTSRRGTNVRYTFSLSGVTAAINQLGQVCKK